jgi:hypothetical protein
MTDSSTAMAGATGGYQGGMPVVRAESRGMSPAVIAAGPGPTRKASVISGRYMGRKTEPRWTRWKRGGSSSAAAPRSPA